MSYESEILNTRILPSVQAGNENQSFQLTSPSVENLSLQHDKFWLNDDFSLGDTVGVKCANEDFSSKNFVKQQQFVEVTAPNGKTQTSIPIVKPWFGAAICFCGIVIIFVRKSKLFAWNQNDSR